MTQVTKMVLEVDLQCHGSYRKVKCILCHFEEVKDQVYDDKKNTVTITVISCDPESLKRRLLCKGKGVIKSIEIKPEDKPKPDNKEKPPPSKTPPQLPVQCVPYCVPICPIPVPGSCRPPCRCKRPCDRRCERPCDGGCERPCDRRCERPCDGGCQRPCRGSCRSNPCDGRCWRTVHHSYGSGTFQFSIQEQEYCSDSSTCRIM